MTLVRWSPALGTARDLVSFHDDFNRLFDTFFGRIPLVAEGASALSPAIDVEESAEGFVIRADLPGMKQKDIKVSLMGDTLTIRGERNLEREKNTGKTRRVERVQGKFERSITLGAPVRNDKVKASYREGVLEVHVPKAEEALEREIEVQVA